MKPFVVAVEREGRDVPLHEADLAPEARRAIETLATELARVRCPEHGTTLDGVVAFGGPNGAPRLLGDVCCQEMADAIDAVIGDDDDREDGEIMDRS